MSRSVKNSFLKYSCFVFLIVIFAVIQNVRGLFPAVSGARACLLLPLVISVSIFEKELPAAVLGGFAGALWDFGGRLRGYNILVLFFLAAFFSVMVRTVFRRNIKTAAIFSFFGCIFYFILYTVFNESSQFWFFFRYHLIAAAYSAAFIFVFYFFVQYIEKRFEHGGI